MTPEPFQSWVEIMAEYANRRYYLEFREDDRMRGFACKTTNITADSQVEAAERCDKCGFCANEAKRKEREAVRNVGCVTSVWYENVLHKYSDNTSNFTL